MQSFLFSDLSASERQKLCQRNSATEQADIFALCKEIEARVLLEGDDALFEYAQKFDKAELSALLVSEQERAESKSIDAQLKIAIKQAADNIRRFHEQQKCSKIEVETMPGIKCWREDRPINSVGLYIPGGTAPLFSTVLMLGIPAIIAGVKNIVLCTPPNTAGKIAPGILWTAQLLGIDSIYKVGGAQAIFAMAYGTATLPKVDKIFGPGNQFVTTAKQIVSAHTAIDMPAGPSEVLVLAEAGANAAFVAADLLSQAEHGADSQVVLVTDSVQFAENVEIQLQKQLTTLPRKDIAIESLKKSFVMVCDSIIQGLEFSNQYAPEHLILHVNDWQTLLPDIEHAGSVFCGAWSTESAGDYASGTNHTLPTAGFARSFSGVSIDSFKKTITFQHLSRDGLSALGATIQTMARAEGLDAHANAVSIRLATDD